MWCKMSSFLHFLQQFYKTGRLTGFAHFQILKIARQEFTSSNIADDNSQTIYLPNYFLLLLLSQVHKRSQVPASWVSPELNQISQQSHKILKKHKLGWASYQQKWYRTAERDWEGPSRKETPNILLSSLFIENFCKNWPQQIPWNISNRIFRCLHHFARVILNISSDYTNVETKCWFGWLLGEKKYASKIICRPGWKNIQVCLVVLLKSFLSAGFQTCNSYARTVPHVLNSLHENKFLHYIPLSVYCSWSKN